MTEPLCACGCGKPVRLHLTMAGNPRKPPPCGPSAEVRAMGAAASTRAKHARLVKAGVADLPQNQWGQRCVEKRCQVCDEPYLAFHKTAGARKTCSRSCAAEWKRQRSTSTRKGESNPNFRNGSRVGVRDRAQEERWYAAKVDHCENPACQGPRGMLALHHCCYRQVLNRCGGDIWDPRNAWTLCGSCHSSHHHAGRRLALRDLPDSVFEFAAEALGPEIAYVWLSRYYAGTDPRLEELLR